MLRCGEDAATQIVIIQPLFDEANRLRKTLVDVMRGLHARGFGVALPDLPGVGESTAALHDRSFDDWRNALRALVAAIRSSQHALIIASFRGGSLIDTSVDSDGIWRLAQDTGARFLRDMSRTVRARDSSVADAEIYDRAGYRLPLGFIADLEQAVPQPVNKLRTVRLQQDPNDADARIAGVPLWRRSEPGEDAVLTQSIIDDLSFWATQCAAS
jgi:pimeloyl-ACP methyl ester carboxylesterase